MHPMRKNTTAAELAKKLKVNIKTVYKYTAVPRKQYESSSISHARPWETLGISRATWYRRKKSESERLS